MKDKVLTIKQMQELIDMGVDVSNSVIGWFKWNNENTWHLLNETIVQRREKVETIIENNCFDEEDYELYKYTFIPTFTLQDILDMLPKSIIHSNKQLKTCNYKLCTFDNKVMYTFNSFKQCWLKCTHGKNLLEAAFNMLKWCKQNNYI